MLVLTSHIIKLDLEWKVDKIEHDAEMLKAKFSDSGAAMELNTVANECKL